jgi:uncharacterized membrane protein YeaQ/YmgE (transglycosylase-associated protein family)
MSADSGILVFLRGEFADAQKFVSRSAQRGAQFDYFVGMLWGVVGLAIAVFVLSRVRVSSLNPERFLGSLVAGGIGAVVSVMSRMTFGKLVLKYEAGSRFLRTLGVFRPLIGAVSGTVLYILVESSLLPIAGPTDASKQLYFFVGIAFLAGFSERWAQDMLAVARVRAKRSAEEEGELGGDEEREPGPKEKGAVLERESKEPKKGQQPT